MKPDTRHAEDRRQVLQDLQVTRQTLDSLYHRTEKFRRAIEEELSSIQSEIVSLLHKQKRAINLLQASNNDTF
jgi:chaperonin cofactor prefoldin